MGRKFTMQKHEIAVRADMETAAYSEYAETLRFAWFAEYPSWQKFTSLVCFSRYNFSLFIPTAISWLSTTLFNAWYIFKF